MATDSVASVVLLCDTQGVVQQVLHDGLGLRDVPGPGQSITAWGGPGVVEVWQAACQALSSQGAFADICLTLTNGTSSVDLLLSGVRRGEVVLVTGVRFDAISPSTAILERAITLLASLGNTALLFDQMLVLAHEAIPAADISVVLLSESVQGCWQIAAANGPFTPDLTQLATLREHWNLTVGGEHPAVLGDLTDVLPETPLRSAMLIPLHNRQEQHGALLLGATATQAFTRGDLRMAEALASILAEGVARAQVDAQLQRMAITDPLTGLYNRRGFFELGQRELERVWRFEQPLVALLFDVDRFGEINDAYGHLVGDEVLIEMAARCMKELRAVDLLARHSGEQFIALLDTDLPKATQVAERLRHAIASVPFDTNAGRITVTISLGVAAYDDECRHLEDLLARAHEMLQVAKVSGRDRVCVW